MKPILALLFSAFLFLTIQPALAQDTAADEKLLIGSIAEIEGIAAMSEGDSAIAAEAGRDVYLNDVIETGPESKALIVFTDDTELTLGENARLTVDEYVVDIDNPAVNKGRFSILRGAFIMATGLISKKEKPDVKIETTYGTIGIRGTIIWGGTLDDQYNVFVQEGEATFATERGRVTLRPGEGTFAQSRRAIPSRAKAWGQEKIGRAVKTVALKNAEKARERVRAIKEKHQARREGRQIERQERLEEKIEQRQEKREELREQRLEKMEEHKEQMQEKKSELMEKREERMETLKENRKQRVEQMEELRGGSTPQEIERREKMHLKRNRQ